MTETAPITMQGIVHVFIECERNKISLYIKQVAMYTFKIDFCMDISRLPKINMDRDMNVLITMAFWCI